MKKKLHVSVSYTRILVKLIESQGSKGLHLLWEGTQLSAEKLFDNELEYIDFDDQMVIIQNAIEQLGFETLGLMVGKCLHVSAHGDLGYAMLNASSIEDAIQTGIKYYKIRAEFLELHMQSSVEGLYINIGGEFGQSSGQRFFCEVVALAVQSILESLVGKDVLACSYEFPFSEPTYAAHYKQYFHSNYAFDQPACRVFVPQDVLESSSIFGSSISYDIAVRQCDRQLSKLVDKRFYVCKIKELLDENLEKYCHLKTVASHFNISTRTLTRKLKDEGVSFHEVLTETRKDTAKSLLLHSDKTIEDIAIYLGYQDPGNFARAFKRWFGSAPASFRAEHRHVTDLQ